MFNHESVGIIKFGVRSKPMRLNGQERRFSPRSSQADYFRRANNHHMFTIYANLREGRIREVLQAYKDVCTPSRYLSID